MTADLILEHMKQTWWILLFIICSTSYFVYSAVKRHMKLKELEGRKRQHEKELADLEAKYSEKVKELEEKREQRKRSLKKGDKR